jgi:ABC-type multidrug transport system permease subunit
MEENQNAIESLFERAVEYGKTSFELAKLKIIDKITDLVSSLVPNSVVFILIMVFIVFLNLGLAFWLGEILGKTYYGFFIVAGFYGIAGVIVHFFMHKRLKKITGNYIIKQVLK